MAARLKVVGSDPAPATSEELGILFKQEHALTHQLAETRRAIYAARQRYAAEHGLLVLPSYDTLRRIHG
jgi:hypothetical protein